MTPAALDPTALPEGQSAVAAEAARALVSLIEAGEDAVVLTTRDGREVAVPAAAVRLFVDMLGHLANGEGIVVLPEHAELSTQQAADLLNVSRPHVVRMIESGQLPARRVGTHRRVLLRDLLAFKVAEEERREAIMRELAEQAQAHGL